MFIKNNKLKELRKAKKLTQKELADRLGVSQRTLQKYEAGEYFVPTKKIGLLCDALGVQIQTLMPQIIPIGKIVVDEIEYKEMQRVFQEYQALKSILKNIAKEG